MRLTLNLEESENIKYKYFIVSLCSKSAFEKIKGVKEKEGKDKRIDFIYINKYLKENK